MLDGKVVKHCYYSDDEYLFVNDNGLLQTEEGYTHSFGGEFWSVYQQFPDGWEIVEMVRPETTPLKRNVNHLGGIGGF